MADLAEIDLEDIFGELRRRNVDAWDLQRSLNLHPGPRWASAANLRLLALGLLGSMGFGLVVFIGLLATNDAQIPDI